MSQEVGQHVHDKGDYRLPLCAGDDYELCFTIDCDKVAELDRKMATLAYSCTWIGLIEQEPGLRLVNDIGNIKGYLEGYEHFS